MLGVSVMVIAVGLGIVTLLTPYQAPTTYERADDYRVYDADYMRATVLEPVGELLEVRLLDGARQGQQVQVAADEIAREAPRGSTILVYESTDESIGMRALDAWRLPSLALLLAVFFVAAVLVGGRRGAMSVLGLVVSLMVIGWGIIPLVLAGHSAFWVCLVGALVIAAASIVVAHGLRRRTFVSIGVIMTIVLLVGALAWLALWLAQLTGLNSEQAFYLMTEQTQVDMRGVLAGGIVLAALGVLDDIVTAQVAAVEELQRANPRQTPRQLFAAASSIGREHISSLVNTLALAYAGASLPFLLLMAAGSGGSSPLMLLNSEYVATEIVRTVVASLGLVVAVPVSTLAAIYVFRRLVH